MEWVAIDVHIAGDAVTHRLAGTFRLRVAEAAGLLTLVFAGMAQHAQDGSLTDVTDSQLEAWALWHGKRGALATFVRAQLCDDDGTVRAWEKYNGAAIREAKASRERMRVYRAKRRTERGEHEPHDSENGTAVGTAVGTANCTQNGTANKTRTVRPQPDRTGPDRTTTAKQQDPSPRAAGRKGSPTWLTPFAEAWKAKFGGDMPVGPAATALAPLRTEHGDGEVLRRWKNYLAVASAEHVNSARFASTWNRWNHTAAPTNGTGKPSTAEAMAASMTRIFTPASPSSPSSAPADEGTSS
jgi:hypothetical protein